MSRLSVQTKDGGWIAYGLDHHFGFWADKFNPTRDPDSPPEWSLVTRSGPSNIPASHRAEIVERIKAEIPQSELERIQARLDYIILDLDPADAEDNAIAVMMGSSVTLLMECDLE